MRAPAKIAGMQMFLNELLAERPESRDEIVSLLAQVGGVEAPKRKKPPKPTGNAFLDLCAEWDAEDAGSCLQLPGAASETPVPSVLLAKKYGGQDPTCYWMSEKLDGVRAIWDGHSGFWSRTGKPFNAPDWFQVAMPQGVVLDGELFAGRGLFRDTISAVRRKVPRDDQWRGITYLVFDMPQDGGTFEGRMKKLGRILRDEGDPRFVRMVAQKVCGSGADLDRFHREISRGGGEGVMLRLAGSKYEPKRSSTLLKVKDFIDEEARVTGFQKGEGKHRGRLGAYHAELLSTGVRFKVGTGLSDAQREHVLPKGAIFTVRYQELTPDGVPRFPVFIAARDYE
jgi:DNA ligase 1